MPNGSQRRWIEFAVAAIAIIVAIIALDRYFTHGPPRPDGARAPQTPAAAAFPARRLGASALFWVEGAIVDNTWHQVRPQSGSIRIERGKSMTLRGWAVDPRSRKPARSVRVVVDGHPGLVAPVNDFRPEVAATLKLVDANVCGFKFDIATDELAPGTHRLTFEAASSDAGGYYTVTPDLVVDVVAR